MVVHLERCGMTYHHLQDKVWESMDGEDYDVNV